MDHSTSKCGPCGSLVNAICKLRAGAGSCGGGPRAVGGREQLCSTESASGEESGGMSPCCCVWKGKGSSQQSCPVQESITEMNKKAAFCAF